MIGQNLDIYHNLSSSFDRRLFFIKILVLLQNPSIAQEQ